jgi:hypothetical protein
MMTMMRYHILSMVWKRKKGKNYVDKLWKTVHPRETLQASGNKRLISSTHSAMHLSDMPDLGTATDGLL